MEFSKFGSQTLGIVDKIACIFLHLAKMIALLLCFVLICASMLLMYDASRSLFSLNISTSIQDGLFVMILLEMLYVIFSFLKYGSINVSLVINVGIIAVVKELVFDLGDLTLNEAIAYSVLIVGLGIGYLVEMMVFEKKKKGRKKAVKAVIVE